MKQETGKEENQRGKDDKQKVIMININTQRLMDETIRDVKTVFRCH